MSPGLGIIIELLTDHLLELEPCADNIELKEGDVIELVRGYGETLIKKEIGKETKQPPTIETPKSIKDVITRKPQLDHDLLLTKITYEDEKGKERKNIKEGNQITAEYLVEYYSIKTTHDDEIFIYNEDSGLYCDNGGIILQEEYNRIWDELGSKNGYNEVEFKIKSKTRTIREAFNPPLNLIPLSNGIYDQTTKKLIEYSPHYLFTKKIPVEHNPEATCPEIDKFITEVLPVEQQSMAYEILGFCLRRGYPLQKWFLLNGGGANGKTQYLKIISKFLGEENISSINPQVLAGEGFMNSTIYQKLANIGGDIPQTGIPDMGKIKQLTGGDTILVNPKYKQPFSFVNYAKLIFSCNEIPPVTDDTYANWRRVCILDFPYTFKRNPNPEMKFEREEVLDIGDLISTDDEMSGLLNKALTKLEQIIENRGFSFERGVEDTRLQYLKKSDTVRVFVEECIEYSDVGEIQKSIMYNEYLKWCEKNNLFKVGVALFGKALKNQHHLDESRVRVGDKRIGMWLGISFKHTLDPYEEGIETIEEDGQGCQGGQGGQGYLPIVPLTKKRGVNIVGSTIGENPRPPRPLRPPIPPSFSDNVQEIDGIARGSKQDYFKILDFIEQHKNCTIEEIKTLNIFNAIEIVDQLKLIGKIFEPRVNNYDLVDRVNEEI